MTLATTWDQLDIETMRARGGFKWSLFPDAIGAFIAEMDFGVADPVAQGAIDVISDELLGYLPLTVEAELGAVLSDYLATRFAWKIPGNWIGSLPDVLRGFEIAYTYYVPDDAPIIVPTPSYTPFLAIPKMHGRRVIEVACHRDADGIYRMDYPAIEAALAEGGLFVLCNPQNPTGRVYDRDELTRLEAIITRTGAKVFSDEIHAPLTFDGAQHIPYASLSEATAAHTVTATSASKAWNIPGLACAQMVLSNQADADRFHALGHFITRGASTPGVMANIAAYRQGDAWLAEVIAYVNGNRKRVAEVLADRLPGAVYALPEATYLAWIDVSALTDRTDLAAYIRTEAGVAVTGGEDCGAAGLGAFRLNLATPRPVLDEVLDRIVTLFA